MNGSLIMNGHVDTVPVGNASDWADGEPFSGRVDEDRIVWSNFRGDWRTGTYDGFGPFEFDRRQYEAALTALNPPPTP